MPSSTSPLSSSPSPPPPPPPKSDDNCPDDEKDQQQQHHLQDDDDDADADDNEAADRTSTPTTPSTTSFFSFRNVANCLTDAVANAAIVVANEIAQLEERMVLEDENEGGGGGGGGGGEEDHEEEEEEQENEEQKDNSAGGQLPLPWEVNMAAAAADAPSSSSNEATGNTIPIYMTDESLMKDILQLSKKESTFRGPFTTTTTTTSSASKVPSTSSRRGQDDPPATTTFGGGGGGRGKKDHSSNNNKTATTTTPSTPPTSPSSKFTFVWNDVQIQSCRRLLDIDPNLSKAYTRLCKGKDKETRILFWKNYFYHCDQVKAARTSTKATANPQPGTTAATSQQQQQQQQESSAMDKSDDYNTMVDTVVGDHGMRRKFDRVISSLDNEAEDDNSLIPASSTDGEHDDDHDDDGVDDSNAKHLSDRLGLGGDDSSYVLASPPTSLNTYLTTRSNDEDDIVVVNSR